MNQTQYVCDPETGLCHPVDAASTVNQTVEEKDEGKELIYVGDPMCSWCWGIANHLRQLKDHYAQFKFSILVGGLRPGGGDPWNDEMKAFLKHHWDEVNKRSGQPFGTRLFELAEFNYDTEPACRAVVAARQWMGPYEFEFYEAVTRKFYVENEDPKQEAFYESICQQFAIPYQDFITAFNSDAVKQNTQAEFVVNRNWGVKGYPTILLRVNQELFQVSHGYADFETMQAVVERVLQSA